MRDAAIAKGPCMFQGPAQYAKAGLYASGPGFARRGPAASLKREPGARGARNLSFSKVKYLVHFQGSIFYHCRMSVSACACSCMTTRRAIGRGRAGSCQ